MTKALTHTIMKPSPFDKAPAQAPPITDEIAHGKYLANAVYDCANCHSADFVTNNELDPTKNKGYLGGGNPLLDLEGNTIKSANLTFDKETARATRTVSRS